MAFEKIQRRTVPDEAIRQIKALVASGELEPGHKLPSERTLSEMLGLSRPSLREAIRALGALGILEIRQGSGTYVTSLSAELLAHPLSFVLASNIPALQGLFEVRLMLEVGAARSAAARITDADLKRIKTLTSQLPGQIGDLERFIEGDIAFHQMIHEASGNAVLVALMESLVILGKGSRMLTAKRREIRERTLAEHRQIYRALKAHDPDAAAAAMAAHLRHVRDELGSDQPAQPPPAGQRRPAGALSKGRGRKPVRSGDR
ncbi:FadR family transcriptional regulator [bacterium]|nr:MAG: FadR family transcriptional regulator [bacterium]